MWGIFFVTQCACTVYIASFGRKRLSPLLYVSVFYTGIFFKFTKYANVDYYGAKRSGIELAWLPDSVTFSFISLQKMHAIYNTSFRLSAAAEGNTVENDTCAWFREIPFGPGRSSQCGVTRLYSVVVGAPARRQQRLENNLITLAGFLTAFSRCPRGHRPPGPGHTPPSLARYTFSRRKHRLCAVTRRPITTSSRHAAHFAAITRRDMACFLPSHSRKNVATENYCCHY